MIRRRLEFKIPVLDTKKNTAIGIALPFGEKPLFKLNYTTQDQVKTNLINFMLTNRGERPFNPHFGADLRKFIFEQETSTDELKERIYDKLNLYFPQITVKELNFDVVRDKNTVEIHMIYSINRTEDELIISLQ